MKVYDVIYKCRIKRRRGEKWRRIYKWKTRHDTVVCETASQIDECLYNNVSVHGYKVSMELKITEFEEVKPKGK